MDRFAAALGAQPAQERREQVWLCLLLAACSLTGQLACGQQPAPSSGRQAESGSRQPAGVAPHQLFFIMLDTARADRMSTYGYSRPTTPVLDELAARGVVFERHYSQGSDTRSSIPTLISSRYFAPPLFPSHPMIPYANSNELFRHPDPAQISLPKLLSANGYRSAAITAHHWTGEQTAFAAEFDELIDLNRAGEREPGHPAPRAWQVVDFALRWVEEHADESFFLYLHFMDNHYPHEFGEQARAFFGGVPAAPVHVAEGGRLTVPAERVTAEDRRYLDALYDGSMLYVDAELGRFIAGLQERRMLDAAVISVTADHGEYFQEQPLWRSNPLIFTHGGAWHEPLAHIPWILFAPSSLRPARFSSFSEGVDVAPTLAALANVALPTGKGFDGRNLLPSLSGGDTMPRTFALMRTGIRTDRYRMLFEEGSEQTLLEQTTPGPPRVVLFDLSADPEEKLDIAARYPEIVSDLSTKLRQTLRRPFARAEEARGNTPPEFSFALSPGDASFSPSLEQSGWQLRERTLVSGPQSLPVEMTLTMPDARYLTSLGLEGSLVVEFEGERHSLTPTRGVAVLGPIRVSERKLRLLLRPQGARVKILFVGFVPPAAIARAAQDEARAKELRRLGYL